MFTITLERGKLLDVVSKIISTCERTSKGGTYLPHFFHIKLEVKPRGLIKLAASNMHRKIEVLMEPREGEDLPICCVGIPGEAFASLVRNTTSEHITLAIGDHISIQTPGSNYRLPLLGQDMFPNDPHLSVKNWRNVPLAKVFDDISRVLYCANLDEGSRQYSKAVCVIGDTFYCTDGFRVSAYPNRYLDAPQPLLLPVESVKSFCSLFKESEGGHFQCDPSRAHFIGKGVYSATNLFNFEAPNFRSAIPGGVCQKVTLGRAFTLEALKRLVLFAKSVDKTTPVLTARYEKDGIHFEFRAHDNLNHAKEYVPSAYDGEDTTISCNLVFFYQAIRSIQEEEVIIELRGANYPIVITDKLGEHKNVIIPTR